MMGAMKMPIKLRMVHQPMGPIEIGVVHDNHQADGDYQKP
jgi:hypothetical protein